MPNRTSFNDLVDNIHSIMGTVSDSAQQSLANNSYIESSIPSPTTSLYEAASQVSRDYLSDTQRVPGKSLTAGEVAQNIGASLVSGTTRLGGFVASLPFAGVASDLQNIPQEYLDAYQVVRDAEAKGLSGPEVEAAKAKLKETELPKLEEGQDPRIFYGKPLTSAETYGSRIESALNAANISGQINEFTDTSGLVNPKNRKQLTEDISKVYDEGAPKIKQGKAAIEAGNTWEGITAIADGATDLLFGGAGSLIDNPVAVAEYVAENIPQLASGLAGTLGKAALTTSTLGYGGDVYTQAILDFQKANEGKLPTQSEIKQMVGAGALAGIADLVGDASVIKGLGKAAKEVKSGVVKSGKDIAEATVIEAGTEAFQTYQEQRAQLQDPNWKQIYEAGLIGGAVGGSVRTGLEAITGTATKAKQTKEQLVKSAQEAKVKQAQVAAAVETGDTSTITDPVVLAETLVKRNQREDITEEEKVTNTEKLNTLVQEEQQNQVNIISELEQIISKGVEGITNEDATKLQTLESQLNDSDTRLASLRNLQNGNTVKPITSTVEDVVKAQEGDTEAAQRVFGSYRIDPNNLSAEEATKLSESAAFTPAQQAELKNHAEFQTLIKSASQVSGDIINGNLDKVRKGERPFIGLNNYKDVITNAMNTGDKATATKYLGMLSNFADHMQTKAKFLGQATALVKSGKPVPTDLRATLADYGITKFTPAIIKFNDNVIQPEANLVTKAYEILSKRVEIPVEPVKQTETTQEVTQDETVQATSEQQPDSVVEQPKNESGRDTDGIRTGDTQTNGESKVPVDNTTEQSNKPVSSVEPEVTKVTQDNLSVTDLILSQDVKEDLDVSQQNLVAKGFVKSSNNSALDTYNNFIESAKNDPSLLDKYVTFEESENARLALNNFLQFYKQVSNSLDTMFKPKKEGFAYQDYVQYLAVDGKLPDNVKAAIAIGAYDWLSNTANQTVFNSDDDIRSMLGMEDNAVIPPQIREQFRSGIPQSLIVQSMGQSALAALNLRPKKTAMMNQKSNLENALGSYSFALLRELDWTGKPIVVSSKELDSTLGQGNHSIVDQVRIIPLKMEELKVAEPIEATIKGSKIYPALFTKLFSIESVRPEPSFKPLKVSSKVKKSLMKVPQRTQEILNKVNAWKWKYNKSYDLFAALDRDSQRAVMGYDFDVENRIKAKQLGIQAKNDSIDREIDSLNTFADMAYGKDFYLSWEVWKNQRMGIKNVVNPQTSKLHRHFIGLKNWDTNVDPTNQAQYNKYVVTVAGGFGITPEKKSEDWVINEFNETIRNNPVVKSAINAMLELRNDTESSYEQQQEWYAQIIAAVELGGQNAYTFQALETLASEQSAEGSTFTHSMTREVDGITNGVNITSIQFPDVDEDMFTLKLARQGMYFDDTAGFAEWKSKGDPDSYEGIASKWKDHLGVSGATESKLYLALTKYVGDITRNTAKSPLMTTIYGAGIKGVIANAANIAIDEMYNKLEEILKSNDVNALKELAMDLKVITGSEPKFNYTASDMFVANKDFELTPNQIAKFLASFDMVYKEGLDVALKTEYSNLFENRDKFNAAINLASEIFKIMYKDRVESLRKNLNVKIEDITIEQHEAIVRDMASISPVIPTLMSGSDLTAGVSLMKTEQVKTEDSAYKVDISFNLSKAKTGSQEGRKLEMLSPGVGAIPIAVQSLDASNIVRAMSFSKPFLNIHDAQAVGDADAYSNPQLLNYSHYKNMSQYSIPQEFSRMFDRIVGAASPEIIQEVMSNGDNARYLKLFEGMDINGISNSLRSLAVNLTNTKNERLAKLNTVGQYYNGEQTVYQVNDLSKQALETAVKEDVKDIRAKATNQPKTSGEQASSLGSSQNQSIKDQHVFETSLTVNRYNVQQVFDYLGTLGTKIDSNAHTAQLKGIIDNMVVKVLDPIDLHLAKSVGEETKGMITGTDMYIVNQDVNLMGSGVLTRMSMSSQEVMAHELIHAITRTGLDKNIAARREIKRIYEIARKTITPAMLAQSANPEEVMAAEELWDYLFNPRLTQGRSNYLHEFVAFSMTNEPVRELLSNIQTKPIKSDWFSGANLLEKIASFFSTLLDWLNGKFFTGTYNLNADKQMDILVRHIVGIQANNRGLLVNAIDKGIAPLSMAGNRVNQFGRTAISKLVQSSLIAKNKSAIVRVGGQLGKMFVDAGYADLIKNTLDRRSLVTINSENAYLNELRAIVTEAKGRTTKNATLHDVKRIGNSAIDRTRQRLRNVVAKHLLEEFDPSTNLGKEEKTALSYAIIKTDMHVLVDTFGFADAMQLLKNPTLLDNEINRYRQGLDNFTLVQAENLGYVMSTGSSRIENGLLNAYNISRRAGTGEAIPSNAKAIEAQVDVLASLYALKYLDNKHKTLANSVIDNEISKGSSNGITAMLYTLKMIREDSANKIFNKNPELMIKGYMADHVDPNVSIKVGLASDETWLSKQGYVKGPKLAKDLSDPMQKERFIYVNRYGGLQAYLAGAVYLQSDKARGTSLTSLELSLQDVPMNLNSDSMIGSVKKAKALKAKSQYAKGVLPKYIGPKMIPIVNGKGEIIDYRYVMTDNIKDKLLNRDTSFEVVMGIMAATPNVKPEITKQNKKVVQALKEQYDADYRNNPKDYVAITQFGTHERYAEIWNMLPYDMKEDIKEIWGGNKMMVRREHVNLLFGYRKYSLTNRWSKDPDMRNWIDLAVINTAEFFFGSKAVPVIRGSEDFIQELVRLGKDVIVIRSFVVTLANTISNLFLLSVKGINPVTAMKDYTIAYKAAQDYKRKSNKIEDYKLKLKNPNITLAEVNLYQSEIAKLAEDIAASPVRDLISQGVLQNIIEDIDVGVDTFTFKKGLVDKAVDKFGLDKVSKGVPSWMKSVASNALVLQGSELYNTLRDMAQLSDFGARYALYNHVRKQGMSKEDAVGLAMDTFIDYDLPTGVGMQYANDMGLVMFSKYLIRVQKIIFQTFRENPAAVLSIIALQNYFNFGSNIHESFVGATNPFDRLSTPLDFITAMENTVTMNMASNVM